MKPSRSSASFNPSVYFFSPCALIFCKVSVRIQVDSDSRFSSPSFFSSRGIYHPFLCVGCKRKKLSYSSKFSFYSSQHKLEQNAPTLCCLPPSRPLCLSLSASLSRCLAVSLSPCLSVSLSVSLSLSLSLSLRHTHTLSFFLCLFLSFTFLSCSLSRYSNLSDLDFCKQACASAT